MKKKEPVLTASRRKKCLFRESPYGSVILDLNKNSYSIVNDTTIFIWKELDGTQDLGSIAFKYSDEFGISVKKAKQDLMDCLAMLRSAGLIEWI